MSKGNLFLGFGRGKVGDVVFSRLNGEQVTRARNRSPRNPRTPLQLLQRVLLKSASVAYSAMQDITNHSFQGFAEGTECQSRFIRLNIDWMRTQLAPVINSGDPEEILYSAESNYSGKADTLPAFMPWTVSEGSLTPILVQPFGSSSAGTPYKFPLKPNEAITTAAEIPTYADVCRLLGVNQGDQLTIISMSVDDTVEGGTYNGMYVMRIILEPANGEMSTPFLANGAINSPNPKNDAATATVTFETSGADTTWYLEAMEIKDSRVTPEAGMPNSIGAFACILSRRVGDTWARSTQSLMLRPYVETQTGHLIEDHGTAYLGDAIQSYMTDTSSLLYLNQAE